MKTTRDSLLIMALGATLLAGAARAQAPAADAPADGAAGGTVTNQTTSTDTTLTTGGASSAAADGVETGEATQAGDALPKTGGEPWLLALGGIALAGGSLALRRKLA
jgi:LPXTG-motif cell wall-anchored protein